MIRELSHPLVKTLIQRLRETETDALLFRHTVAELSRLLCYEALADQETVMQGVETWQGIYKGRVIAENELVLVPILRAGTPMLDPLMGLFPEAPAGFLAMRRDETTHEAVLYYDRVPDCKGKTVVLLDPMVATGGSLCDAVTAIKAKGAARVISLNIIGAPEGLDRVTREHPDLDLVIAQIDERLDAEMFIHPGLGDAGDRAYNTID
jgi:uracil phosphoribosyltransferase